MPTPIPLRFESGVVPVGVKWNLQQLADGLAERLIAYWDGSIGFVNGGPEPTSNQGPWLRNGNEWRFWNPSTGSYSLGVFQAGDIMPTGYGVIDSNTGWLSCDGSSVAVSTYPLLFGAIGYTFGGSAGFFNLPDFQGRTPVGQGSGSGLTTRLVGQKFGVESVALSVSELPANIATIHSNSTLDGATGQGPEGDVPASSTGLAYTGTAITISGGGLAHQNMQPSIVVGWKIKF